MSESPIAALIEKVSALAERVRKYRNRSIGEQNTKASLIEPVLEAVGWDIRDLDEVHREFKATTRDRPVDYALKILRKPRLFIEAKGLGESLADRKWVSQVLGYATVAGVEWCILTDGNEYRFYNATAAIDADEKLFCKVSLTEDVPQTVGDTLNLISRRNLEENLLDVLWASHFVDRRVKATLEEMMDPGNAKLIRLVRRKVPNLKPGQIAESLARLDIKIESPVSFSRQLPDASPTSKVPAIEAPVRPTKRKPQETKQVFGVKLSDVIKAGLLKPPLRLFRHYKGRDLEAKLLPDGRVEFSGTIYDSGSTAAEYARGSITGRRMTTNGWTFWQYQDASGQIRELDTARCAVMESRKQLAKD